MDEKRLLGIVKLNTIFVLPNIFFAQNIKRYKEKAKPKMINKYYQVNVPPLPPLLPQIYLLSLPEAHQKFSFDISSVEPR